MGILLSAQEYDMSDEARIDRMKRDVHLLASDSLLGREAGSKGEIMAMHYLADHFKKLNLKPVLDDNTYFQEFEFISGATYKYGTAFQAGDEVLEPGEDFYPLSRSASGEVKTELIDMGFGLDIENDENNDYADKDDIKGKVFFIELSVPGGAENFDKYSDKARIEQKIKIAENHGAAAVVFVNNDSDLRDPADKISLRKISGEIPVVFVKDKAEKQVKDQLGKEVKISVNIRKIRRNAYNIVGMIDNNAAYTLVLGAHYDHLGMGGSTSLDSGLPKVHNGADDNASGVAGILEMSRKLRMDKAGKFNYLVIAFSAEEHGLVGSTYPFYK